MGKTMDTTTTIRAWSDLMDDAARVAEALHLSGCEALEYAFPAIVRNDEIMAALAAVLDPFMAQLAEVVSLGIVPKEAAEEFLHNMFHALQIAAALGHMHGVDETMGTVDVPVDLSELAWGSLPDVLGEEGE